MRRVAEDQVGRSDQRWTLGEMGDDAKKRRRMPPAAGRRVLDPLKPSPSILLCSFNIL